MITRYDNPIHPMNLSAALEVIALARMGVDTAEAARGVDVLVTAYGEGEVLFSAGALFLGGDAHLAANHGRGPLSVDPEFGRNQANVDAAGIVNSVGMGRESDYRALVRLASASQFSSSALLLAMLGMLRELSTQYDEPCRFFDTLRDACVTIALGGHDADVG